MPISIALGLTVLTFIFGFTNVPMQSVALKLFTGLESFEIMAIPFFILAGNFLTHGGVAKRMINFATSLVGHWYGGLGLAAVLACAMFAAISGSSVATRRRDRLDHDAGDGQGGLPEALRRRRHHHLGRARHPDPAVDRDGDLLGRDQHLARRDVHRRRHPRHRAGVAARHHHLVSRAQEQLPAHAARHLGRALGGVPRSRLGPAADRHRHGRHLHRHVHADRGRGDGRGLLVLHLRLRLQGPEAARRAARAAADAPT